MIKKQENGKHRYVISFCDSIKKELELKRKPYPKRVSSAENGTGGDQSQGGGVIPTDTLQSLQGA